MTFALAMLCLAQTPAPMVPLWEGRAPLANTDKEFDKPKLHVYLAAKPNGSAAVICPGGGYAHVALDHEGKQVAEFLNKLGIHAFVLEYRLVNKDRPGPLL